VQVEAYREGCDRESQALVGGGVFTTADTGPVFVNCIGVEVLDTLSFEVLGDTVVTGTLRLDATTRSDTLEIDLEV
jgi:hypothetical protein